MMGGSRGSGGRSLFRAESVELKWGLELPQLAYRMLYFRGFHNSHNAVFCEESFRKNHTSLAYHITYKKWC